MLKPLFSKTSQIIITPVLFGQIVLFIKCVVFILEKPSGNIILKSDSDRRTMVSRYTLPFYDGQFSIHFEQSIPIGIYLMIIKRDTVLKMKTCFILCSIKSKYLILL